MLALHLTLGALILLALHYLWVDMALWRGLSKIKEKYKGNHSAPPDFPLVSVLVCARNEIDTLSGCLEHLLAQDYPADRFEILVANDRSTDGTGELAEQWATKKNGQVRVLHLEDLPAGLSAKKHALSKLVPLARGEILLLTDADCEPAPRWISSIIACYEPHIQMVAGYSYMQLPENPSSFLGIQALEFNSHHVVSAASIGLAFPITVSGNNLSYRKSFFEQEGGFAGVAHIVSGDDDLLLHKLTRRNPRAITYCPLPGSHVRTWPQPTLRSLWEQRKRWASKTLYYTPRTVALLSLVFLFYLTIPTLFLAALAYGSPSIMAVCLAAFACKTAADLVVMSKGCALLGTRHLLRYFVPTALIHIPLIVGAVFFGILGKFRWKT